MTRYALALSTEGSPQASASEAVREMDLLIAGAVEDGFTPPAQVDIGRTAAGEFLAYCTMTKEATT